MRRGTAWVLCPMTLSALAQVGGSVHNNTYDIEWHSFASNTSGWNVAYQLHNQRSSHVRIRWVDSTGAEIYDGWIEQTPEPLVVATIQLGLFQPDVQKGTIEIGKLLAERSVEYEFSSGPARSIQSTATLGILLNKVFRRIRITAISTYTKESVDNTLSMEPDESLGSLRFVWKAAGIVEPIQLVGEPFKVRISAPRPPHVRTSALVVLDPQGTRLGAIYAPVLME